MARRRTMHDLGEDDWYRHPSWYDVVHAPGTAPEVDGVERIAARYVTCHVDGALRWLEPACGTARHLRLVAARGGRVWGFDQEPAMLEYARRTFERRGLDGVLFEAPMDDFALPDRGRIEVAFNLISTIRHLMTDEEVLAHLGCVARVLRAGGVYAVGLGMTAYGAELPSEDVWRGARGRCRVTQVAQYLPADRRRRRERVVSHMTVRTPNAEHHMDTSYELRAYSGRQWAGLLERSPFEVVGVVDDFGDPIQPGAGGSWCDDGVSGYAVWVLRLRPRPRPRNRNRNRNRNAKGTR